MIGENKFFFLPLHVCKIFSFLASATVLYWKLKSAIGDQIFTKRWSTPSVSKGLQVRPLLTFKLCVYWSWCTFSSQVVLKLLELLQWCITFHSTHQISHGSFGLHNAVLWDCFHFSVTYITEYLRFSHNSIFTDRLLSPLPFAAGSWGEHS